MRTHLSCCILVTVVFLFLPCVVQLDVSPNTCPALNGRDGRDGKDGSPGLAGSQGPPGEVGTPGLRGAQGPPGKVGPPGIKGDPGEKGDKGDKGSGGDTGKQGLTGFPGIPGSKGNEGQKGEKGATESLLMERMDSLAKQISMLQIQVRDLEKEFKFSTVLARTEDKFYATNGKEGDYETALKACKAAGGTLPTPLNAKENSLIAQFVASSNNEIYLGLTDIEAEGVFKLLSGRRPTYTDWFPGQPDNYSNEDCVEMQKVGGWNDISCTTVRSIVCEFRSLPQ